LVARVALRVRECIAQRILRFGAHAPLRIFGNRDADVFECVRRGCLRGLHQFRLERRDDDIAQLILKLRTGDRESTIASSGFRIVFSISARHSAI
jgi:hypothetical protein